MEAEGEISKFENEIQNPSFPESKEADEKMGRRLKDFLEIGKNTPVLMKIWGKLIKLLKIVCLHPNANGMPETVKACFYIMRNVEKSTVEANPILFETWAPVGAEILHNLKEKNEHIFHVLSWFISELRIHTKPAKNGHNKLWIPILLGCIKWPNEKILKNAKNLLREDKLKRTWKWKENLESAKKVLTDLGKLTFPKGNDRDARDMISEAAGVVEDLMDLLEVYKVNYQVQKELSELCITLLEKCSAPVNYMTKECGAAMNLKKNRNIIANLLHRFYPLFTDEDYPWEEGRSEDAGERLIQACLDAYDNAKEISDDAHEAFLQIFKYACKPGLELISFESGGLNMHGSVLSYMSWYIYKFEDDESIERLAPLLPCVFECVANLEEGDEQENLKSSISSTLMQMANYSSESLAPFLADIINWYLKEPSSALSSIIQLSSTHNIEVLAERFSDLIEAFVQDEESYVIHGMMLNSVAEQQPDIFDESSFSLIMEYHWMHKDTNSQVLMAVDKLVETRADLVEPHFIEKVLNCKVIMPAMANSVSKIILCVVANFEEYKQPVIDYFIKTLKSSSDDTQITAMLIGLRGFVGLFGPDTVKPHLKLINKFKSQGGTMYIKDAATQLLNDMEGRSLEKVSADVKQNKGDIEKLQIGLAGTKVVVRRVSKMTMKHDKEIKKAKAKIADVDQKVDVMKEDLEETKGKVEEIDMKTMTNAPTWSRDVTKLMNPQSDHDWRLLSSRLGYSADDIRGWATQSDPCMAMLSEWYATHKTVEATHGVLVALQEMNREDAAVIVENAMKAVEGIVADEPIDYPEPPEIFLSYQWGHQNEVKLIQRHMEKAGYKCWMDVGQMGGGDKLFEKIDSGIRAAKIIICCVTEKYAKSPNCNREVNLSVNLGKPIIPLLLEKMSWPPKGSMGPIFSEYLFIRFFQRPGEETNDDRIWPVAKFQELLMQLNCFKVMPDESAVTDEYKSWWIPVVEEIVIQKKESKSAGGNKVPDAPNEGDSTSPDVFISYQWGKQREISVLYQRLTGLGYTCWMDIHQMGGGDSLYDKIDRGIRGCKVVLTSITQKYALSANCRREVSLADALKKPIIPLLMEKSDWPPSGPMSMVFTQLLFINFCKDESVQLRWDGPKFEELQQKLYQYVPLGTNEDVKQGEATMATVIAGSSDKEQIKKEEATEQTKGGKSKEKDQTEEKDGDDSKSPKQQLSEETKGVPQNSHQQDNTPPIKRDGNGPSPVKPRENDPSSTQPKENGPRLVKPDEKGPSPTKIPQGNSPPPQNNPDTPSQPKKSSTCTIL